MSDYLDSYRQGANQLHRVIHHLQSLSSALKYVGQSDLAEKLTEIECLAISAIQNFEKSHDDMFSSYVSSTSQASTNMINALLVGLDVK